jgi:hypothetical protein
MNFKRIKHTVSIYSRNQPFFRFFWVAIILHIGNLFAAYYFLVPIRNGIYHHFTPICLCEMLQVDWDIALKKLDLLRGKLTSVSPVISKKIENMKFMHLIYLDLYLNGENLFSPSKRKSELMFHISHHFAMILILIDEVQFLKDGRILRPYQEDIASCGEFVHPTETDSFFSNEVDLKVLNTPLCVRSIFGYFFEESSLLKLVSTIFKINNYYEPPVISYVLEKCRMLPRHDKGRSSSPCVEL